MRYVTPWLFMITDTRRNPYTFHAMLNCVHNIWLLISTLPGRNEVCDTMALPWLFRYRDTRTNPLHLSCHLHYTPCGCFNPHGRYMAVSLQSLCQHLQKHTSQYKNGCFCLDVRLDTHQSHSVRRACAHATANDMHAIRRTQHSHTHEPIQIIAVLGCSSH